MRRLSNYLPMLVLLGAMVARADDKGTPPPAAPAKPAKPAKVLSVAEMTTQVNVIADELKSDIQTVEHLRTVVRRERDVIKLNCVNDKYVELKAQVNMFDTARDAFTAATDQPDNARVHFDDITKASAAATTLRTDAQGCIGVPELSKTEGGVEVHHPVFPDDPTTATPFDDVVVDVDPPGYASPFN